MTQELWSGTLLGQQLEHAEYLVNTLTESAKQYWRWWGPLGEPMIRATEEWADAQRKYLRSLKESQGKQSGSEEHTEQRTPTWRTPVWGLTFAPWPGPGGSEGGGWDR